MLEESLRHALAFHWIGTAGNILLTNRAFPRARRLKKLSRRVGSGQQVFEISRVASRRVGSQEVSISRVESGRVGSANVQNFADRVASGRVPGDSKLTGRVGSGRVGSALQMFEISRIACVGSGPQEVIKVSRVESGRVGPGGFQNLTCRVGSGQEVFKVSRVGSGRVESTGVCGISRCRIGSPVRRFSNITGRVGLGRVGSGWPERDVCYNRRIPLFGYFFS